MLRYLQRALVTLLMLPIVVLTAIFAMLLISIGFVIMAFEVILPFDIGGSAIYNYGVKHLPSFYYGRK